MRSVALGLALPLLAGGLGLTTLGLGAAVAALPPAAPISLSADSAVGAAGPIDPASGSKGGGPGPEANRPLPAPTPIPAAMLGLYASAAVGTCLGLPWSVLAAVGTVESNNGESNAAGVHSGANAAGAEGPMQFEPATFAEYDRPAPPGGVRPPSPYDPVDAVWAAARLLCADGAARGDLSDAVYAYNHSLAYVAEVLSLASSIDEPGGEGS